MSSCILNCSTADVVIEPPAVNVTSTLSAIPDGTTLKG